MSDKSHNLGYNVKHNNYKVRKEFEQMLRKGTHPELMKIIRASDKLLQDTISGNEAAVAEAIRKVRETNYVPVFYNAEQALRYTIKNVRGT